MGKLIEKGVPKVIQDDLTWRHRATSGSIFEILEAFVNTVFLMFFGIGKKLTNNVHKLDFRWILGESLVFWGWVGTRGVALERCSAR